MSDRCHGFDHEAYCAGVEAETAAFVEAIGGADPAAPVPTCGSWLMYDLVEHCGHIHRWATAIAGKLSQRRLTRKAADWPLPADPADHPAWFTKGGLDLVEALRVADPDAPCWAWGADQRVRFWSRRMLHETTVHRCDAQLALGLPATVEPAVAVDGIDEFLDNLPYAASFAPGVRNLRGDGGQLRLSCPDREVTWTITLHEDGFSWSHERGTRPVDAAVNADATDLYLVVWGRISLDDPRVGISGDRGLLGHWLRYSAM
ncbi:MAG: hypothetical protein QOE03_3291 [Micromonosporaceae bacterium]|jgi:uncharacterized protein (TIGR03083 family)|nr:hypothetical protein [Micromonosporaceae bacterium]